MNAEQISSGRAVAETLVPERPLAPIKFWAMAGALFLIFEVYVYSAWISSGKATPTDPGPTPIPTFMVVTIRLWETTMVVSLVLLLWFVVLRPYRRDHRLSSDGIMVLALFTMYIQDPWLNWTQTVLTYNAAFTNFGSWVTNVPGWLSPNGNQLPEPTLGIMPQYPLLCFAFAVVGCRIMRKAKARWPRLGRGGLILIAIAIGIVGDLILEPLFFLPLGMWSYPGAIHGLTLFEGRYYQFPIYEAVLAGLFFGMFPAIRYFRNDKGDTIAERGIDTIRTRPGRRTFLRFLSLVGFFNLLMIGLLNAPWQIFSLHGGAWPEDVTKRSYLMNGFCGPGTTYACSSPDHPIPRPGSARVGPNGELVPAGR